ncbi:TetR/AcrR family transcriptional regulator [Streptomyces sp. TRM72054]|nr:TetR/AcrR family transcriptional regulator [Streptomyces sp. TRM72054]
MCREPVCVRTSSLLRFSSSRGYAATGVKDITDAAGAPKGSFYNHFKSKEALDRYGATRRKRPSRIQPGLPRGRPCRRGRRSQ